MVPHRRRHELRPLLYRRDEVGNLLSELPHIVFGALAFRHRRADVEPELQRQFGGAGTDKLARRRNVCKSVFRPAASVGKP